MRASLELRFQVSQRARGRCEYCLFHEQDAVFAHEVDHVIGRQHGGSGEPDNLAFACLFCNRCKGTNVASVGPEGAATARLLKFNAAGHVMERSLLHRLGRYPRT